MANPRRRVRQAGIYAITNTTNGKQYIGCSNDVLLRWSHHRTKLRGNRHPTPHLQAAWNHYGEAAFAFTVLEVVKDVARLVEREQWRLDRRRERTGDNGYNASPNATRREYVQRATPALEAYWARLRGKPVTGAAAEALARGRAQLASMTPEEQGALRREGHARGKAARGGAITPGQARTIAMLNAQPKSATHRARLAAAGTDKKQSPETIAKRMASIARRRQESATARVSHAEYTQGHLPLS